MENQIYTELIKYGGGTATWAYNGYMDEVGIWSKVLSSTEISDLYNGGNGNTMMEVFPNTRRRLLLTR